MLKILISTMFLFAVCCGGDRAGDKEKAGEAPKGSEPPCACLISESFPVEDPPDYAVYYTEIYRNEEDCLSFDVDYYLAPKDMGNQLCGVSGSCTEAPTFMQWLKAGKVRRLAGIEPQPDFVFVPPAHSPIKILMSRVATFRPKKNKPEIKARIYLCEHTHPKCHCVYGIGQEITGNLPVDLDHPQDVDKVKDGEYDVTYGTVTFRVFTKVDSD